MAQFKDYFEGSSYSIILMELLKGGGLFQYISSNNYRLTEAKCRYFARQLLHAVKFMHDRRIIHLDLKPENIVLSHSPLNSSSSDSTLKENNTGSHNDHLYNERLKLIDFGIARDLGTRNRIPISTCGTLEFISPEVLRCTHASFASDMWSIGVIFFMMLSGGISPFWDGTERGTEKAIAKRQFVRGFDHSNFRSISTQAIDCVSKLLTVEPSKSLKV